MLTFTDVYLEQAFYLINKLIKVNFFRYVLIIIN